MIPNKSLDRLAHKAPPAAPKVVDPAAPPTVAYEEVLVDLYDIELPCGPSQFMVEVPKDGQKGTDYFKKSKDEYEFRQGGRTIVIPRQSVYYFCHQRQMIRRAVHGQYQPKTT